MFKKVSNPIAKTNRIEADAEDVTDVTEVTDAAVAQVLTPQFLNNLKHKEAMFLVTTTPLYNKVAKETLNAKTTLAANQATLNHKQQTQHVTQIKERK